MKLKPDNQELANKVVNHVAHNLDKPISIEELSSIANLSKFHFHRVFRALTGETVSKMVNRLRLESAASTLIYQRESTVTQVAVDHGYSSGANFTKAFTKYFGVSPSVYRKTSSRQPTLSKNGKAQMVDLGEQCSLKSKVNIVYQHDLELAYIRQAGAYEHLAISRLHKRVRKWVTKNSCEAERSLSVGITWSDSHIASEELWRYDACLAVKQGTIGSDGISIQRLNGSKVAQLRISLNEDDNYDLSPYWNWFVGSWLPNSKYELNNSTSYELYEGPTTDEHFIVRLCLPLR